MGVALFPILSGHQGGGEEHRSRVPTQRVSLWRSLWKAMQVLSTGQWEWCGCHWDFKGLVCGWGLTYTHKQATKIYTVMCGASVRLYFSVTASCSAGGDASVSKRQ